MPSSELAPASDVPALEELAPANAGDVLDRFVAIKLNGGLATTMGLEQPKSLVQARDGRSFLEIIIGQTLALRKAHDVRLPLILMNSEATQDATAKALADHPELEVDGLGLHFVQSMIPKLDSESLAPASWAANPALEWCPPGHGDVYGALRRSGMLEQLLERGFRYAMISNSDNLGAALDPRIAALLVEEQVPFMMEVVIGTEAERKGGHLARRERDGQLVLREIAQTPDEDQDSFRDFRRWRYYNTNSVWLDLHVLAQKLEDSGGFLELPLIINRKTVDPRDSTSTPVIQLESAMGAAIGSFDGARLLQVPRNRFVPVKTTDDLLLMRSDAYRMSDGMVVQPIPERDGRMPYIELDKRFYKLLDQFEQRFPAGPPSLKEAERLVVNGDFTFGRDVVVRGAAELDTDHPARIESGSVVGSQGS